MIAQDLLRGNDLPPRLSTLHPQQQQGCQTTAVTTSFDITIPLGRRIVQTTANQSKRDGDGCRWLW